MIRETLKVILSFMSFDNDDWVTSQSEEEKRVMRSR